MSQKSERVSEGAVATCPTAGKGLKKTKAAFIRYTTGAGVGWGGERRFLWWFLKFLEGKQGGGGEGDGKNFGRQEGAGDAKLIFWRCHSKIKY